MSLAHCSCCSFDRSLATPFRVCIVCSTFVCEPCAQSELWRDGCRSAHICSRCARSWRGHLIAIDWRDGRPVLVAGPTRELVEGDITVHFE